MKKHKVETYRDDSVHPALVVAVVDIATGGIPVPLAGALLLALAATVTLALMEALR